MKDQIKDNFEAYNDALVEPVEDDDEDDEDDEEEDEHDSDDEQDKSDQRIRNKSGHSTVRESKNP